MRVFRSVVQVSAGSMPHLGQNLALRHSVALQPIGHDAPGLVLQTSEQALEEPLCRGGVPAVLDEDVEHNTVLVHRAPEVIQLAIDLQEHLIEVPSVARLGPALTELSGEVGAELEAPLPDALMADDDASLGQDKLHLAQAQAEHVVQPDGIADDLGWEAVSGVGDGLGHYLAILPQSLRYG